MTCQEFEELLGAYVLDAITPEERRAAEAHLAGCEKCTRLYNELRPVAELLALSVPQVDPPESLKERVMAAIRREREREASGTIQRAPTAAMPIRRAKRLSRVAGLLAAAVLLLLVLLGAMSVVSFSLNEQLAITRQQLAATQQKLSSTQQQLTIVSPRLLGTIAGSKTEQGVTGDLFFWPQQNITVLIIQGLPQPGGSKVYQGWLVVLNGRRITRERSVGLLSITADRASVSFPGNVADYNAAAVSLEPGPAPSKDAPAGPVVALGKVK